jgi:hypothetical protein
VASVVAPREKNSAGTPRKNGEGNRVCALEDCSNPVEPRRGGRSHKRFCSERCQRITEKRRYRVGSPNLALELDQDGEVIAKQVLSLRHPDEDEFADLGEEEPQPDPIDMRNARPAPVCDCPKPRHDDGNCGICGRSLPAEALRVPEPAQRVPCC